MKKKQIRKMGNLITYLDTKTSRGKVVYYGLVLLLLITTIISVFPLIWATLSGLKSVEEYYAVPITFWPKDFHWENITDLFTRYKIHKYIFNTLKVILGTVIVEIVVTASAGYVLSRIRPKGWRIAFTVVTWIMMMPTTLSMVPLFMTFIDMPIIHVNLMNTYWPMWIMAGANCYHVMLFKDFFDGIPISYVEAAEIDGASKIGIFFRIILPLSKPIIATVMVFSITSTWNSFLWPYLLIKDKEKQTIAQALYTFSGDARAMQAPQVLMFSIIVVIPMIIVYYVSQKFIVNNTLSEGEKG